jgi:hypothetical protein
VWIRLSNCSHAHVSKAGRDLNNLRSQRNRADDDARYTLVQASAAGYVKLAEDIIRVFDAAKLDPTRTQITDAMKVYERDVLKDVTWHP